jgi:4-amino-4-deoxy-L-arabinose transferase-like glycosyltransferase/putative flippase GtrA
MPTKELPAPTPLPDQASAAGLPPISEHEPASRTIWQFLRFGLVGCLNTTIDLLTLNCLLWLWPTQNTALLLLDNSLAYTLGAVNSFLLNRYWTFQRTGRTNAGEVMRFVLTALAGTAYNDLVLWFLTGALHPGYLSPPLWTNISKVVALASTVLISFLAMRLWVFVQTSQEKYRTAVSASGETNQPEHHENQSQSIPRLWQWVALGAVMLVSVFMNFYQLGRNGFGNLFYAAGVKSMTDSLHNFFFVSYDPGGFVTIDKPPLGFWLQAISAKIFGFTPFSIFLPQALAGVLAVLVLFVLVRRHFGFTAGLLAALALALSPLSVVTNRNNTIDSTLALILLLGAWAIMRAAESGKLRWLLLSAALVGIGFNIKMMEAYLVVPAFGLLYLLAAPLSLWRRIGQLLLAMLVLLTVSLSWAIVVDLTPASQRPYVGSSQDNSEISLAFGYNGVDRLLGRFGLGGNRGDAPGQRRAPASGTTSGERNNPFSGPGNTEQWASGNFRGFGSGQPGPLRLFNEPLGGQISWLLPVALLGMLALAWQSRPRFQSDRQQQSLLLWGTWLLTMAAFFSIASFFHQYYMTIFAPAICALFGIGLVVMWRDYCCSGWRGWLLPLAILATALEQIYFITSNPAWGTWLIPLIAIPCVLVVLALSAVRLASLLELSPRALAPALGLGVAALLLTPAVWSAMPGLQNSANRTPVAGPVRQDGFGDFARDNNTADPALLHYLETNQGNEKFLVATPSSMSANSIILATNEPVMAMGGFAGADPILTVNRLNSLVDNGTVRFFLLSNPARMTQAARTHRTATARNLPSGGFGFGRTQNALTTWVTMHCIAVPANEWQSTTTSGISSNAYLLYDCATAR